MSDYAETINIHYGQSSLSAENGRRNLQEGRMVVVRAVFERPDSSE